MEKATNDEKFMSRTGAVSPVARNSTVGFTPVSLDTIQLPNFETSELIAYLMPASVVGVLTIDFPPTPTDGQVVNISSTKTITLLTLGGGTILGAITTLLANGFVRYAYNAVDEKWYRLA